MMGEEDLNKHLSKMNHRFGSCNIIQITELGKMQQSQNNEEEIHMFLSNVNMADKTLNEIYEKQRACSNYFRMGPRLKKTQILDIQAIYVFIYTNTHTYGI